MTFKEQALARQTAGLRDKYLNSETLLIEERIERHRNPGAPQIESQTDGRILQNKEIKTAGGGTAVIRTDITRLKKAEMALSHSHKDLEKRVEERCAHLERELNGHRRTRELLSTAVESISDGFALYEADNKLVMCNQMLK